MFTTFYLKHKRLSERLLLTLKATKGVPAGQPQGGGRGSGGIVGSTGGGGNARLRSGLHSVMFHPLPIQVSLLSPHSFSSGEVSTGKTSFPALLALTN